MTPYNTHRDRMLLVARALGPGFVSQTAFVGGCATGLLITDSMTKESVRYTDDVDLIVHVIGYSGWHRLSKQLGERGFHQSLGEDVNCRFRLGELQVDFMPDDATVLGFTNRWYQAALRAAVTYALTETDSIRVVSPDYFLGTKFEAFKGRGRGDVLASHDIEDVLNIVDGRAELLAELPQSPADLKIYLAEEFTGLLQSPDIAYAVQATAQGDPGREQLVFERMEAFAGLDTNH